MGYSEHPGIECDSRQEEAAIGGGYIVQKYGSLSNRANFVVRLKPFFNQKTESKLPKVCGPF